MTIIEFLNARLDEREKAAKAAAGEESGIWAVSLDYDINLEVLGQFARPDRQPQPPEVMKGAWYQVAHWDDSGRFDWRPEDDRPVAEHIAANDPEFVLADIAVKRKIVRNAKVQIDWANSRPEDHPNADAIDNAATVYESVLDYLALPYADHADYQEEWAL